MTRHIFSAPDRDSFYASAWTRRDWLIRTTHTAAALTAMVPFQRARAAGLVATGVPYREPATAERLAQQAFPHDPNPLQALVTRALDAARAAGARYADARLTRSVGHYYKWQSGIHRFAAETEVQGFGVRALVDGYWGFSAAAIYDADSVVRLAQDAVAQARINATISKAAANASGGAHRPVRVVDLAPTPVVTGSWATPVKIDPFTVPVEEKLDAIASWDTLAIRSGLLFPIVFGSALVFIREEGVVGTTEGTLVTQTTYRTGGGAGVVQGNNTVPLTKLDFAGRGWELVLEANIPQQILNIAATPPPPPEKAKPVQVGSYTIVCDGATMAALLDATLGLATQLDRALGYEANASGTSYLNDPLAMLGTFQAAAPLVTVTANRSAPTQLATVQWDDEGVIPEDVALIKNGVLVDYQTTREQASWLAPYYHKTGKPIRSHGYAGAESSLVTSLQMSPNVALASSPDSTKLEDLIASVPKGIMITGGTPRTDFQGLTGFMRTGTMREIKNGRVGQLIVGGAVRFSSLDLWKKVSALGGAATVATVGQGNLGFIYGGIGGGIKKGEPAQSTAYSVQAPAAIIREQAFIDFTQVRR